MARAEAGRRGPDVRSDCWISIETTRSGLDIEITSKVATLYGDSIRELVAQGLKTMGITSARVEVEDQGALPFVIMARLETAARRLLGEAIEPFIPEMLPECTYGTSRDRMRRSRLYLPGNEPKFMLNAGIHPCIPEKGSVGASGDLVQLSHLALGLIGEGDAEYQGQVRPMADIFKELKLKPIEVHIREGLGLINGTSVMTGIGIINAINARKLYRWSVFASSMINQLVESYNDHFSEPLNQVKKHPGQNKVASHMRSMLKGSKLLKRREEKLFNGNGNHSAVFLEKVQEYYSLRCVPQVLGPILETIDNTCKVLINEVNSVNDNPIIDSKRKNVFHGGNFHGDYVSFEMDRSLVGSRSDRNDITIT